MPPRQCTDCHVNNNYNLTSTACVSCHLKDFQGTTNPNHVQAGFAQTCESATPPSAGSRRPSTTRNPVPADRLAHRAAAAMRGLPRQQQLQHHQHDCITATRTTTTTRPTPVPHTGFPHDLRAVPRHLQWTDGKFRPLHHRLPADRLAYGAAAAVHRLPRQQQLQPDQHGLHFLPPEGLQGHDESDHVRRIPADLRDSAMTPRTGRMRRSITRQHRIPADRPAHRSAARMHRLPRQQQLQSDQHACVTCHLKDLPGHDQSESRHGELPDRPANVP